MQVQVQGRQSAVIAFKACSIMQGSNPAGQAASSHKQRMSYGQVLTCDLTCSMLSIWIPDEPNNCSEDGASFPCTSQELLVSSLGHHVWLPCLQ